MQGTKATTPQRFRQAIIQADQRETGSDTGVAFVNPDDTAVVVLPDLFQGATRVASPVSVPLQPNQHYAKLLSELFPAFGNRQGTMLIEAAAGRSVPCMALRLDGVQLTGIPVRPLGFVFQYTVTNDGGAVIETGFWMFDLVGFNLIGTGKVETPSAVSGGAWLGYELLPEDAAPPKTRSTPSSAGASHPNCVASVRRSVQ